ncbi:PEP/pyruvate-binding domain-containing protein, partial [Endozoicomonas sp. ONNA2]|uniref:PEP/pyruvate-binding domain-containing protein n=1 Tax=Endozoicomonas sp. ONNA2 TaxID=2828741 RepID=UPI002147B145
RSSGINEDNYGDAQAGKYLSLVQGEDDVLRTCLEVMASGYRPELCPAGLPQPMALIIQKCIDCQSGGVGMSFQSFRDNTIRLEFTRGQPRGAVAGQSGNTPHRIDIFREDRKKEAGRSQYFPGTISSHFILEKKHNGYSETRIAVADAQSNDGVRRLTDRMVAKITKIVTKLENRLLCPVEVEFAINRKGRLRLLQARPVTRLSGDMVFAMPLPESKETLAIGVGISEGFCTGPLWLANRQQADSMPRGAIVLADHTEDWMLEPKFLKRAGGFVLAKAGFNDHVAILLKQENITLMRVGEQFAALAAQAGQQVTLACARFNDEPGAFIVAGDLTGKLASHKSLSTAFSDVLLAGAVRDDLTPPEGTFLHVASAFQWLSDQNARLLAFFAPGGGLDCLANPVKLSMSPQRSELLTKTQDSVNRLVGGAEALLDGYGAFLSLAGNGDLSPQRKELPQLINRFEALKQTIQAGLNRIILPMQAAEKGQAYRGTFRQWVSDCHQLKSCLQALDPVKAERVRSVHELIFALHQRFVEALAPVTLASDQGRKSKEIVRKRSFFKNNITYVDCTTPGKSGERTPFLSTSVKESIRQLADETTVISMDDALIVNLNLGGHLGLVELLEHAEGGKGRTLRLTFSDQFDAAYYNGKFQRVWFLAQLLKAIKLDENAAAMKLACNPVARKLIVEYSGMTTREDMQAAFKKLMIVLDAMYGLDIVFHKAVILEQSRWDFNLLAQRLNPDVTIETDEFNFQHCLFSISYLQIDRLTFRPAFCELLSNHLQQFVHYANRLGALRKLVIDKKIPKDSLWEILRSDEMSEDIRTELIHHLSLLETNDDPIPPFEDFYDRFRDAYYILKPTRDYQLTFLVPPSQSLSAIKKEVSKAVVKDGLKYVSQRIRGDKDLVIAAIKLHKNQQKYIT